MSKVIAAIPIGMGIIIPCLGFAGATGQEPPVLQNMEWRRDELGELSRAFPMEAGFGLKYWKVFGHLLEDSDETDALLPSTLNLNNPLTFLNLVLTGNRDVSVRIGVHRLYQLLDLRPDIGMLRSALTEQADPENRLARLDKLMSLRLVEHEAYGGLASAILSLDDESVDPWVRRAARSFGNVWQGKSLPSRPPATPPVELPKSFDLLVYALPPKFPDPSPLFAAFRRMIFRSAQMSIRSQGASMSPAQLLSYQDAIDLPQILPYEYIRRFGPWQVDSFLYCTKGSGEAQQFFLEAQGEFDLPDLLDGLKREGLETKNADQGFYDVSGSPWNVRVAKHGLRVGSEGYTLARSENEVVDLRSGNIAAVALLDFTSLSESIPWLAILGKKGTIKLSFSATHAVIELRSDGDVTQFSNSLNRFCKDLDKRIEASCLNLPGSVGESIRPKLSALPWAFILLCRDSLLALLEAIDIKQEESGIAASLSISSKQFDQLALVWYAVAHDQGL